MAVPFAKILAIDDEPDFEALLKKQRFRRQNPLQMSTPSASPIMVRKRWRCWRDDSEIELLLLDINMPVMDGLTLPVGAAASAKYPVRAIIVSAYGDMANIRTAMNRGAFDFVTKPVDLNDFPEITVRKTK